MPRLVAVAVAIVARPATIAPPTMSRWRPCRSPSGPMIGRMHAAASPNELTAMPTWASVPPSSPSTKSGRTDKVMLRPRK